MGTTLLKDDHILLTSATDVDSLCAPLTQYGINYFSFVRIYDDGSRFDISNNAELSAFYYNSGQYKDYTPEMNPDEFPEGFLFASSSLQDSATLTVLRNDFNLDHVIAFIQQHKSYYELWHFGSTPENHGIINFYLNHLDILKSFCFYFKDQAQHLISQAEKNRLITNKKNQIKPNSNTKKNAFETNRYCLGEKYDFSYLTKREVECISWFAKGKTAQEIAMIFNISKRTVDTHIESAKRKLRCYKLPLLIAKAIELGIIIS